MPFFLIGVLLATLLLPVAARGEGSQQTSGVTVQTVIDHARYFLNENLADYWTDARLLPIVNYGVMDIASVSKCMEKTQVFTLQTGVTSYKITGSYISLERVVYSGATTAYDNNNFKGLERTTIQKIGHKEDVGEPAQYYSWADYIVIDPKPSSSVSGYTITAYVIDRPSSLTLSGTVPTPAIYDEALVLFVASRALRFDSQHESAKELEAQYTARVSRFREDVVRREQ